MVTHAGGLPRWAAQLVTARAQERVAPAKADRGDDLVAWLAGGASLVAGLVSENPTDRMWAWGKEQNVGFWSRRMVHEFAVHYADAAIALGLEPEIAAPIAIDGIDVAYVPGLTVSLPSAFAITRSLAPGANKAVRTGFKSGLLRAGAGGMILGVCRTLHRQTP